MCIVNSCLTIIFSGKPSRKLKKLAMKSMTSLESVEKRTSLTHYTVYIVLKRDLAETLLSSLGNLITSSIQSVISLGPNYSHNLKNSRKNYVRKSIKKSVPRLRNTFFIQFEVFYVKFLLLLHDHLIQYFHFSNIEPFHDHDLQLRQYHFSELY